MSYRLLDERDIISLNKNYSNALTGKLKGTVVRADDVSPMEHEVAVKVKSKNLFNQGALNMPTGAVAGITITYLEDEDCFLLNGTATITSGHCTTYINLPGNIYSHYILTSKYVSGEVNVPTGQHAVGYFGTGNTVDTSVNWLAVRLENNDYTVSNDLLRNYITRFWFYITEGVSFTDYKVKLQLEEKKGETASEYTPYYEPSEITVTRCGNNFWHSKNLSYPRTVSGVTIDYDPETQIYTFNGTSTSPGDIYVMPNNTYIMHINAGETWTLKVEVIGGTIDGQATSSGKMSPLVNTSDYINTIHANAESLYATKTYTEPADITKMYFYVYAKDIVFDNFKCRIQFEPNNKPTEFEKSIGFTDYTPASDGKLEILSSSPTMALVTDKVGVNIECEYIKDANAVIEKLINAIVALGGTV